MATIHIIHGYIAFGKTTLAKKLAQELPAVHLDAVIFNMTPVLRNKRVLLFLSPWLYKKLVSTF